MIGYVSYTEENRGLAVGRRRIGGLTLLEVRLGKGTRMAERFFARRGAKVLARRGIREAVFPMDYPHQDLFLRRGIWPVETLPLYRAMAPMAVRLRMGALGLSPGTATAAVAAERVTPEVERLVEQLSLSVRYVLLCAAGGEGFCERLRREYGLSVQRESRWERLAAADVLVLLRPAAEGIALRSGVVLRLYDGERVLEGNGVDFALPRRILEQVEPNCGQKQLLTLLLRERILQNYQIPIMEVDIPGKSYYNASTVN